MTKEEYLKKLILQRWTLKDFAAKINMPYGTLYSILKNVDGGSMYNTKELPDLRSILSSTFLFNGTEYTLSEKKQDMLSQIIQAVLSEKT